MKSCNYCGIHPLFQMENMLARAHRARFERVPCDESPIQTNLRILLFAFNSSLRNRWHILRNLPAVICQKMPMNNLSPQFTFVRMLWQLASNLQVNIELKRLFSCVKPADVKVSETCTDYSVIWMYKQPVKLKEMYLMRPFFSHEFWRARHELRIQGWFNIVLASGRNFAS
jgi:hypothetical protein